MLRLIKVNKHMCVYEFTACVCERHTSVCGVVSVCVCLNKIKYNMLTWRVTVCASFRHRHHLFDVYLSIEFSSLSLHRVCQSVCRRHIEGDPVFIFGTERRSENCLYPLVVVVVVFFLSLSAALS